MSAESLALYRAAETRSALQELALSSLFGDQAAATALAEAAARACLDHAVDPGVPGVAEVYRAALEATALACLAPLVPSHAIPRPA